MIQKMKEKSVYFRMKKEWGSERKNRETLEKEKRFFGFFGRT